MLAITLAYAMTKWQNFEPRFRKALLILLAFVIYTLTTHFLSTWLGRLPIRDKDEQDLLIQLLRFASTATGWIVIGYLFQSNLREDSANFPGWIPLLVFFSVAIHLEDDMMSLSRSAFGAGILSYQLWGDLTAMLGILYISRSAGKRLFYTAAIFSITLFWIPSRASFIGFLIVLSLTISARIYSRNRTPSAVKAIVSGAFIVSLGAAFLYASSLLAGSSSRLSTLSGIVESKGDAIRGAVLDAGLEALIEHPIFGAYGFQVFIFGEPGYYVHNILDVPVQYGVMGFILFIALILVCLKPIRFSIILSHSSSLHMPALMALFSVILFVGARNYQYGHLYLAFGMLSAFNPPHRWESRSLRQARHASTL